MKCWVKEEQTALDLRNCKWIRDKAHGYIRGGNIKARRGDRACELDGTAWNALGG